MTELPIILLGGTGDVGKLLARRLRLSRETQIIVGSRRPARASKWAPQIFAELLRIDTAQAKNAAALPSPAVVVNLTEATSPDFISACLSRGIIVLDTSASELYFRKLEAVGKSTERGTVVPQVGLMPGLTNLLARAILSREPNTRGVRVFAELGLGRHYGRAATVWTLRGMGSSAGRKRRRVTFPGQRKKVMSLSFPFSDSIAIQRDANLDWAESYIAFSPSIVTRALDVLLRLGVGRSIARNADWLAKILAYTPTLGRVTTRILVVGFDAEGTEMQRLGLAAFDQAELTAFVIEQVLTHLPDELPIGLVPITHLTTSETVISALLDEFPGAIADGL